MKKSLTAMLAASAVVLSFGLASASAQESVPASAAENGNLWFVELAGNPTADGNSLKNVRAEKAAFKAAARAAGVSFKEMRSFDVLFNGYSVEVDAGNRNKLAQVAGVKALWPVEVIQAPNPEVFRTGAAPDLATAIVMTGADIAQNTLGFTGAGVKVAVMDTGIDYDHADLGGDGVQRSNSSVFPTGRVIAGYDLVGDAYDFGLTPVPDAYPDDCAGHGSHVAGIVGANGAVTGVAPDVLFGSYRVFGCAGSTGADIMISAMEMALADGMQVLNMSIGSARQWPEYPTAAAATRLVNKGVVVVASIGNNGPGGSTPDGVYAAGAPGVGKKVIGVASFDNTHVTLATFTVTPANLTIGYANAAAAPPAPTSGSLPLAKTGTPTTTNDGCAVAGALPSLTGKAVLIRRGTCGFYEKARRAQLAGASAVVLYNNAAGRFSPTVAISTGADGNPVTIPVVAVSDTEGVAINNAINAAAQTLNWQSTMGSFVNPSGGLISGFSSFGLAADLSLKPDIGAPGGLIRSTYPLESGGYATISGTSMSSPHTAGGVALLLEARPNTPSNGVRTILQNSADPKNWWAIPAGSYLDNVHRQGAGLVDIDDAILATTKVEPGKLSLGESQAGPSVETLRIENNGPAAVIYDLSHAPALATGPAINPFTNVSEWDAYADVSFSSSSVVVPAGGSATVNVTITAPAEPELGQYGGYIVFTPQGGGQVYRVPYAGFIGDYQAIQVLKPTANGFPWLAQIVGSSYFNRPTGGTYTMAGSDIPFFLLHLDHQSRRIRLEAFDAVTGKSWHRISDDEYLPRNSTATSFFAFSWDGMTYAGRKAYTAPDGQYVVKLSVLKALGDASNPAHWETWTSPVITVDRP